MSWLVQSLLRNKVKIKTSPDLESDEYNDLLIIEKKVESLANEGILSEKELTLLLYISDGKSLVDSQMEFGKNRWDLAKDFSSICTKIAFYAGGYFTDEGYISYMTDKYKLNDEQIKKLEIYMKGKYKNKLIRNSKNSNGST